VNCSGVMCVTVPRRPSGELGPAAHSTLFIRRRFAPMNGDTHLAEDVTQSVFAISPAGRPAPPAYFLTGWLFTSNPLYRDQRPPDGATPQHREREAHAMNAIISSTEPNPIGVDSSFA